MNRDRYDMCEIRGQTATIDTVVQAVHERANLLLMGPPSMGRIAIARRITTLLPPLTDHAKRWIAAEYTMLDAPCTERPFRAPHHTISTNALIGPYWSLHDPKPAACSCKKTLPAHVFHNLPAGIVTPAGELQLARFGVLLLDDPVEFRKEAVRQLGIRWHAMPAHTRPMLVATANECPCGWLGSQVRECGCGADSIVWYRDRIAEFKATLAITITAHVPYISLADMRGLPPGESSAELRSRLGW